MDSLLIIVGVLALLTVAVKGNVLQTLWLCLSLLDTFRALKTVRQNGRRVGVTTRRRLMRQCLTSWIVFVVAEPVTIVCDAVLYWFPFYSSLKQLALLVAALWRTETSGWLFEQLLVPVARRYEKHIDLTLLLVHSLYSILFHFLLDLPVQFLRRRAQDFGLWPVGVRPEAQDIETPTVDHSDKSAEGSDAAPDVPNGSVNGVEPPTVAPPVEHQQPKPVTSAPRQPLARPRVPSAASSHARARVPSDTNPGGVRRVVSGSSISGQPSSRPVSSLKAPAQRLQRLDVPRGSPVDLPRLPSVPTHDPISRPTSRPPPPSSRSVNVPRTKRVVSGDAAKTAPAESSTAPSTTDVAAEKPAPKPKPVATAARTRSGDSTSDKASIRSSTRKSAAKSPAAKKTTRPATATTRTRPKRVVAPPPEEDTDTTGAKRTRSSTTDLPASKRVRR